MPWTSLSPAVIRYRGKYWPLQYHGAIVQMKIQRSMFRTEVINLRTWEIMKDSYKFRKGGCTYSYILGTCRRKQEEEDRRQKAGRRRRNEKVEGRSKKKGKG